MAEMTRDELRARLAAAGVEHHVPDMPQTLLLRPQIEKMLGLAPDSLRKTKLPPPDALVGGQPMQAWTESTVLAWDAVRQKRSRVD